MAASSSNHSTTSIIVEEDMWLEILKILPVKTLSRFRCVCKSLNSLISSTSFIASHHNLTVSRTPTHQKSYYLMDNSSDDNYLYHIQSKSKTPLEIPFKCSCYRVIGVIHGVVCLASRSDTVFWNPTTHKYIARDNKHFSIDDSWHCYVGFGYNASNKDFKAVIFSPWNRRYHVISFRDDFWSKGSLPTLTYKLVDASNSCFVNGNIYWIIYNALLLFDCESQEFKTMKLPQELVRTPNRLQWSRLYKYADMLSALRENKSYQGDKLEFWVMEEEVVYGVASGKWKKLFNIDISVSLTDLINGCVLIGQDVEHTHDEMLSSGKAPFQQPLNGQVFEESLFLMDAEKRHFSDIRCCCWRNEKWHI